MFDPHDVSSHVLRKISPLLSRHQKLRSTPLFGLGFRSILAQGYFAQTLVRGGVMPRRGWFRPRMGGSNSSVARGPQLSGGPMAQGFHQTPQGQGAGSAPDPRSATHPRRRWSQEKESTPWTVQQRFKPEEVVERARKRVGQLQAVIQLLDSSDPARTVPRGGVEEGQVEATLPSLEEQIRSTEQFVGRALVCSEARLLPGRVGIIGGPVGQSERTDASRGHRVVSQSVSS